MIYMWSALEYNDVQLIHHFLFLFNVVCTNEKEFTLPKFIFPVRMLENPLVKVLEIFIDWFPISVIVLPDFCILSGKKSPIFSTVVKNSRSGDPIRLRMWT